MLFWLRILMVLLCCSVGQNTFAEKLQDGYKLWKEIEMLNNQATQYGQQGKYEEAILLAKRALAITTQVVGKKHFNYAIMLGNLGALYRGQGDYTSARSLFEESSEILNKTLGSQPANYAKSLINLASIDNDTGNYKQAEQLYLKALTILKPIVGEQHIDYVTGLNNLAGVYQSMGNYTRAEQMYLESAKTLKKTFSKNSSVYATSLNNLAGLYKEVGNYARTEQLYIEAAEILKKTVGKKHPHYAASLNNLADLYTDMGNYTRAEQMYIESAKILKTSLKLKEQHLINFFNLNGLAKLYANMGYYTLAESLYLQSQKTTKIAFGEKSPVYAISINALADLYKTQENYTGAEPLFIQALKINKNSFGEDHPTYANSLNNLAELYRSMGNYANAELMFTQSKEIRRKVFGEHHPTYANTLNNLAELYRYMGNYVDAELMFAQALEINKNAFSIKHPNYAQNLNNLAELYRNKGNYANAELMFIQAKEIIKALFGEYDHDYILYSNNLAALYDDRGEYTRAKLLYEQALSLSMQNPNSKQLRLIQNNLSGLLVINNPAAAIFFGKQAVNLLQDLRLNSRSMDRVLQKSLVKTEGYIYSMLSSRLLSQSRIAEAQQILSISKEEEYYGFTTRDSNKDPRTIQATYTDFEQEWADNFTVIQHSMSIVWKEMNELLQKRKFEKLTSKEQQRLTKLEKTSKDQEKVFYAFLNDLEQAFDKPHPVKFKGGDQLPSLPVLQNTLKKQGEGVVLLNYLIADDKLHIFLTSADTQVVRSVSVHNEKIEIYINEFRALMHPDRLQTDLRPQVSELYNWFIKPIEKELQQAKATTLLLSLDSKMRYFPMAALYNMDNKKYLIEQYALVLFTQGGKHLVEAQTPPVLSIAGMGVSEKSEGSDNLPALPAVKTELKNIVRTKGENTGVLEGVRFLNKEFNVSNFQKALKDKYPIAHIASHFVLKDNQYTSYLLLGDGTKLTLNDLRTQYANAFKELDLITLSACNTAMGKDTTGREVEALGAILQDNGAKGVLATLWPVYDDSTGELMQRFYELRAKQHLNKAAALQKTQQEFIKNSEYQHPYFWAPFLLMGNWL